MAGKESGWLTSAGARRALLGFAVMHRRRASPLADGGKWSILATLSLLGLMLIAGSIGSGVTAPPVASAQRCDYTMYHNTYFGYDLHQQLFYVGNGTQCYIPHNGAGDWQYTQTSSPQLPFMQSGNRDWECGTLDYSNTPSVYSAYSNYDYSWQLDYGTSCGLQSDMNANFYVTSVNQFWNYQNF